MFEESEHPQAKPVMAFITELENKIRAKNKTIAKLEEDVDKFMKLYAKAAFLQPWGALVTGGIIGGVVVVAVLFFTRSL